jgi:hypothetical protein
MRARGLRGGSFAAIVAMAAIVSSRARVSRDAACSVPRTGASRASPGSRCATRPNIEITLAFPLVHRVMRRYKPVSIAGAQQRANRACMSRHHDGRRSRIAVSAASDQRLRYTIISTRLQRFVRFVSVDRLRPPFRSIVWMHVNEHGARSCVTHITSHHTMPSVLDA